MTSIEFTGNLGSTAVRKLRKKKLQNGLPFMINAKELPTDQCYLEYPDGCIKLVTVNHSSRVMDVMRELTTTEATDLRRRFHFSYHP